MKAIHPKWYEEAKVTCSCGNTFTVGAAVPEIEIEVCSACHPFYTGKMKYLDAAGRVDAFKEKRKKASKKVLSKRDRRSLKKKMRIEKELKKPDSLEDLRKTKSAKKAKAKN